MPFENSQDTEGGRPSPALVRRPRGPGRSRPEHPSLPLIANPNGRVSPRDPNPKRGSSRGGPAAGHSTSNPCPSNFRVWQFSAVMRTTLSGTPSGTLAMTSRVTETSAPTSPTSWARSSWAALLASRPVLPASSRIVPWPRRQAHRVSSGEFEVAAMLHLVLHGLAQPRLQVGQPLD